MTARAAEGFQRLDPDSTRPIAVALSGGGDSTALLLMATDWARDHRRPLIVLTVDHRLQVAGADWARHCAALAARLGHAHRTLVWEGPKPTTGVSAAARRARHRLLADAAHQAGAQVILLGHTADDVLEAALMRQAGSTVPDPREWAPSPVWPEGRGLFLLRPLLGVRRASLRDWLRERGEPWIEDPANEAETSLRARVRRLPSSLRGSVGAGVGFGSTDGVGFSPCPGPSPQGEGEFEPGPGECLIARGSFSHRHLAAAIACAGGRPGLPRPDAVDRLLSRIAAGEIFTASLAGARIDAAPGHLTVSREAGDYRRHPSPPLPLPPGVPLVWDGRYEVTARRPGFAVRPLAGLAAQLPAAEKAALKLVPAAIRPSLPLLSGPDSFTCPILAQSAVAPLQGLVFARFKGAVGAICREAAIGRVANEPAAS